VIAVVASVAWMAVSSALILLNKDLLSHGFHYPMALSGLGMAFSGGASFVCCRVRLLLQVPPCVVRGTQPLLPAFVHVSTERRGAGHPSSLMFVAAWKLRLRYWLPTACCCLLILPAHSLVLPPAASCCLPGAQGGGCEEKYDPELLLH
jgi:hypothetical protein